MGEMRVRAFGTPKGQPRTEMFFRHKGKPFLYTPGTANEWKSDIAGAFERYWTDNGKKDWFPLAGPIRLHVVFYMARPKSHFRVLKGKAPELKSSSPPEPIGKPDMDNLLKAVMDAVTGVGVWGDDCQVIEVLGEKLYAVNESGASIKITWRDADNS